MGDNTPLHWSDQSLDPVMVSARITPVSRDEDRRHERDSQDAPEQDSQSQDHKSSGAGEEIVDTVSLSETARKLLAAKCVGTDVSIAASQPDSEVDIPASVRDLDRGKDIRHAYRA